LTSGKPVAGTTVTVALLDSGVVRHGRPNVAEAVPLWGIAAPVTQERTLLPSEKRLRDFDLVARLQRYVETWICANLFDVDNLDLGASQEAHFPLISVR
jgi:hypothetical protein